MSVKKPVSLLLSILLIISVFTAATVTTANADDVKHKITFTEEGYHAFVVLYGGETERVTEAAAGTEIHISRPGDAVVEEGCYFTGGYLINGNLNYGSSFRMPDCDVTVTAYNRQQTKATLDLTSNEQNQCIAALHDHLIYHEDLRKEFDSDKECYLIDLDDSGTYDISLTQKLIETPPMASPWHYYIQRLENADADGKFTYKLTSNTSMYSEMTLILSYEGITRYHIYKPDFILTSSEGISGVSGDRILAEPGERIRVIVNDTDPGAPAGEYYFTGNIVIEGATLCTDENGNTINEFIMPANDVSLAAETELQVPFYQNLSDGKAHAIPSEFDTMFRYDEPVEWHGQTTDYYLDLNNSGVDDVHCFSDFTYDENGHYVDGHFYMQRTENADVTGVFTLNRGGHLSEYSSVNFIFVKCGDADSDGNVSVLDATAIQRWLVDLEVKNFNELCADANCDNEVDIIDATVIQRRLVGYDA